MQLADIVNRYGGAYLARHGSLLPSHQRALLDISTCRTPARGAHIARCQACEREHLYYHSCRNRSCPRCAVGATERWIEQRRAELLPVPYFHLVFTLPQALRPTLRRHHKALLPALMRAAAESLIALARDPRYVGGTVGVLAVLHTWSRTLTWHPHVHCLVPGVGVTAAGAICLARKSFLVPVRALSDLFRARFVHHARGAVQGLQISETVFAQRWVVFAKPTARQTDTVLRYLGRYVHRVAISNHRILGAGDGRVTFRYTDTRDHRSKTMTLDADEFLRRFLQHVLPRGMHKIRYYGLLSPARRHHYRILQLCLAAMALQAPSRRADDDQPASPAVVAIGMTSAAWPCPYCGTRAMRTVCPFVPATARAPPATRRTSTRSPTSA